MRTLFISARASFPCIGVGSIRVSSLRMEVKRNSVFCRAWKVTIVVFGDVIVLATCVIGGISMGCCASVSVSWSRRADPSRGAVIT